MALYAIGDLHLSLGTQKPMDVFGGAWVGFVEKLERGFQKIQPQDTVVLLGDLSWALNLNEAAADFAWINKIPGTKMIIKGNHDYWWTTATKFRQFCAQNAFDNMEIINNNCFFYDRLALCGTRGWFFAEEKSNPQDQKVLNRELMRLEASLKAAGDSEKIVFLHYPPKYKGYQCDEILNLMHRYGVRQCFYGHLHGASHSLAMEGLWNGIDFHLVSADKLNFTPYRII